MKFSFGIITDGNNDDRVNNFISTVEKQNIKDYEIISAKSFSLSV